MNWSRAKTILIIVFLIVDIFLFYQTYTVEIGNKIVTDKRSIDQVVEYLGKQDIKIKCSIPTKSISSSLLTVKYKYFDKSDALNIFFDSMENVDFNQDDNKFLMENDVVYLEIKNNGEILYTNRNANLGEKEVIDEIQSLKNAEKFLRKLNIIDNEIFVLDKTIEDNYVKLKYSQGFKDMFIDDAILEIKATNKGIAYMKMLWFESIRIGKTKKEVIPPIKALMKLPEIFRDVHRTVTVEEISQGYYFNTNIENVKEFDIKTVEEGTAIPVWRIKTNMGYIYINAYNGTVEKN